MSSRTSSKSSTGPISAEVISTDTDGILKEGRELAKMHPNIVVKVPLIPDGLKATRIFTEEGIKTNVTLCFSPTQGLLAAKAGATYISPFIGRIDDISGDGMELIGQLRQIYDNYGFTTEILAASIRHPKHVVEAAMVGADVSTLPHKVILQLAKHPAHRRGAREVPRRRGEDPAGLTAPASDPRVPRWPARSSLANALLFGLCAGRRRSSPSGRRRSFAQDAGRPRLGVGARVVRG